MLQPGTRLADRYEIVRIIGEGGMGEVYEARHVEIAKRVAVKVLNPEYADDEETLARFHQEARIAGNLGHVNICEVLDFGLTAEGQPFLVMEYLEGESLKDLIRREGRLAVGRALPILDQVLFALEEAHASGIIHRDLKPENVFLARKKGQGEVVKLLDFGISKVNVEGEKLMRLTRTGTLVGTPYYMSPEQVRQQDDVDHRADIYACGVILFEMLVGNVPFGGRSFNEVIVHILEEDFSLPADVTDVDPYVRDLLASALDKNPQGRPTDAAHFRELIAAYLQPDSTAPSRMLPGPGRADLVRSRWRRTALYVLLPVVGLFTLTAAILLVISLRSGVGDEAHDNIFPVPDGERWGFVNDRGEMVISPIYDGAGDFSEGYARVRVASRWGYVDRRGTLVIEPSFDEAGDFSGRLARVLVGDRWGYIDPTGRLAISPLFDGAGDFSEGLAPIRSGEKYGYVDPSGKVVIAPQFIWAGRFSEGLAAVETGKEGLSIFGYVAPDGRFAINPVYAWAGDFSEGRARVKDCTDEGRDLCPWRFVDRTGQPVFEPTFDWAEDYSEGLALVMSGGRWGFVDASGHWAIDPRYAHAGSFRSGRARAAAGGRWGYIDTRGQWVVTPRFYLAGDFAGDAAAVAYVASFDPQADAPMVVDTAYVDLSGEYIWNAPTNPPVNEPPGYDRTIFNFDFLTGEIRVIGSFDPSTYDLKFREEQGSFTTIPLDLPHPVELGRIRGVIPAENYTIVVADNQVAITLGWAAMLGGETTLLALRLGDAEIVKNVTLMELTEDVRGDNLVSWALGEQRLYLLTTGGKIKYRDLDNIGAVPGEHILRSTVGPDPVLHFSGGLLLLFSRGSTYMALTQDASGRLTEHQVALDAPLAGPPSVEETYEGLAITSDDQKIVLDVQKLQQSLLSPEPEIPAS